MPVTMKQDTAFYVGKKALTYEFTADGVSSEGGLMLLKKLEQKHHLIRDLAARLPDTRNPDQIVHTYQKQMEQRVYLMGQGYEDVNAIDRLKNDPLLGQLLDQGPGSQPTLSRMETGVDRAALLSLYEGWVERYLQELDPEQETILLDVDTTDDPTHGNQQLSLFHGYYGQWMYQELVIFDGQTGRLVLPVLLPGTWYPGKAAVFVLDRLLERIRACFPKTTIRIRADSGFSCPGFYELVARYQVEYCLGLSANSVLKEWTRPEEERMRHTWLEAGKKQQQILGPFPYQAGSWSTPQQVYAKVESTGVGMNVRYFVSNRTDLDPRSLYYDFYVRRGEHCEKRIKELKNMCYSDRLSCHRFWANAFRLLLSGLVYEFLRRIQTLLKATGSEQAARWNMDSIRLHLLKIGTIVTVRVRQIRLAFSRAFAWPELLGKIIQLC